MKLSILMPALASRRPMRRRLEASLLAQSRALGDVEVLVEEDDGRVPSGEKRNRLLERSQGEYFAFVDDDDRVRPDYIRELRAGCRTGADVVSFWIRRTDPTRPTRIQAFSIHYQDKQPLAGGKVGMMANHLCAWRREVGSAVSFPPNLGYNDDLFWYKPLLASGLVKREAHVARVLYVYRFHPARTMNERRALKRETYRWAGRGIECFRRGAEILVAAQSIDSVGGRAVVPVRDRFGRLDYVRRSELKRFYVCKAA